MCAQQTLYISEHVAVKSYTHGESSCLFVTFCAWHPNPSLARAGFGDKFLQREHIDSIHIVTARNNWFQSPDVIDALTVIKQASLGYNKIVTYGSSMGGYGAINFADFLNADVTIAIAPQFSIWNEANMFEKRWRTEAGLYPPIHHFIPKIADPVHRKTYIIYDPMLDLDKMQVEAIQNTISCVPIPLPSVGHADVNPNILKSAVRLAAAGSEDKIPRALKRLHKEQRRSSGAFYLNIVRRRTLNRKSKLRLILKGIELSPGILELNFEYADFLKQQNEPEKALEILNIQRAQHPRSAELHSRLASILDLLQRPQEALIDIEHAIHLNEDNAYYKHQKAFILSSIGENDAALKYQMEAVRQEPDSASFRFMLGVYSRQAGLRDQAISECKAAVDLEPKNIFFAQTYASYLK